MMSKEKKGQSYFLQFYLDFFSSLLHSSESKAAGGPAESGRANVTAGSHQTSELVSYLGLSGLNLHRRGVNSIIIIRIINQVFCICSDGLQIFCIACYIWLWALCWLPWNLLIIKMFLEHIHEPWSGDCDPEKTCKKDAWPWKIL